VADTGAGSPGFDDSGGPVAGAITAYLAAEGAKVLWLPAMGLGGILFEIVDAPRSPARDFGCLERSLSPPDLGASLRAA